jgi:hypothetical protein
LIEIAAKDDYINHMRQHELTTINDILFYVHTDELKQYNTGANQIVWLISDDLIVELNIFFGYYHIFLNDIRVIERSTSKVIVYEYSIKNVYLVQNQLMLLLLEKLLDGNSQFIANKSYYRKYLLKNFTQLFSSNYQKQNNQQLIQFLNEIFNK